jgi:hypothetical protein
VIAAYTVSEHVCEDAATSASESVAEVRARVRARESECAAVEAAAAKKVRVRAAFALVRLAAAYRSAAPSCELPIEARERRDRRFDSAIVAKKQQGACSRGEVRVVWRDDGWRERETQTSTICVSNLRCSAELERR